MTEQSTPVKARAARGKSFPVISLPQATAIVQQAGAYGKQHTANALAAYAGHKTANSGPWKAKAAALRDWGLITTAAPDSFALTERALQIAHPTSTDATKRALREAFGQCQLYVEIYDDMAKGVPLKTASIANKAVTEHGISIASKEGFGRSFVESAIAVGLAENIGDDSIRLLQPMAEDADSGDATGDGTGRDEPRASGEGSESRRATIASDRIVHQVWPLLHGEVVLSVSSTMPLDAKAFVGLGQVVEAIGKFVAIAGGPEKALQKEEIDVPD